MATVGLMGRTSVVWLNGDILCLCPHPGMGICEQRRGRNKISLGVRPYLVSFMRYNEILVKTCIFSYPLAFGTTHYGVPIRILPCHLVQKN